MLIALALGLLAIPILLQRSVRAHSLAGRHHPLELGVFFAWVGCAYGALPLVGIALASWDIGELHDSRLGGSVPDSAAVSRVGLMYLLFLAGFALAYGFVQSRAGAQPDPDDVERPARRDLWIAVALLVAVKGTMVISRAALGIQRGEDYLATYTEFAGQPLIVQQLAGILTASELSVTILVIVVVMARHQRWHVWLAGLVLVQIAVAIAGGGSRTNAFACALAYVVARSLYDRRMRLSFVVAWSGAGLALFLLAGLLRQTRLGGDDLSGLYLLQGGEFLSIFYNSLDLSERLQDFDSAVLRAGLYTVDILRVIPRQVIGDLKLDPATVYVSTYYPEFSEAGGGLAFGAIAESTIGFGPLEALVRGTLVGGAYALIRNICLRGRLSVIDAFVYTWFFVLSYQAIRDTTFSVFPRFLFQVVPLLLVLWATGSLRRKHPGAARRRHKASPTRKLLDPTAVSGQP
jgi:hypothetical protein